MVFKYLLFFHPERFRLLDHLTAHSSNLLMRFLNNSISSDKHICRFAKFSIGKKILTPCTSGNDPIPPKFIPDVVVNFFSHAPQRGQHNSSLKTVFSE